MSQIKWGGSGCSGSDVMMPLSCIPASYASAPPHYHAPLPNSARATKFALPRKTGDRLDLSLLRLHRNLNLLYRYYHQLVHLRCQHFQVSMPFSCWVTKPTLAEEMVYLQESYDFNNYTGSILLLIQAGVMCLRMKCNTHLHQSTITNS